MEREARQAASAPDNPAWLEKQQAALQAKNLVELFADSPFKGLDIEFDKDRHLDYGRD